MQISCSLKPRVRVPVCRYVLGRALEVRIAASLQHHAKGTDDNNERDEGKKSKRDREGIDYSLGFQGSQEEAETR